MLISPQKRDYYYRPIISRYFIEVTPQPVEPLPGAMLSLCLFISCQCS